MQEGAKKETPVQEEREPVLEPGSAGAHEDSHPLPLLVRSLRQESTRRITLMTRQITVAEAKYGVTLAMAVPGKGIPLARTLTHVGTLCMFGSRKRGSSSYHYCQIIQNGSLHTEL